MSNQDKITTIKLKKSTKVRFDKLGEMRETSDDVLNKLLDESWFLPKLNAALLQCETDVEQGKQTGNMKGTVADELIKVVREFVESVEAR